VRCSRIQQLTSVNLKYESTASRTNDPDRNSLSDVEFGSKLADCKFSKLPITVHAGTFRREAVVAHKNRT